MSLYKKIFMDGMCNNCAGTALVMGEKEYSYYEVDKIVGELAQIFSKKGIVTGDKVIVTSNNPLSFSLILLSLMRIGAIPMPVYVKIGCLKLTNLIETYTVNFMVTDVDSFDLPYAHERIEKFSDINLYKLNNNRDVDLVKVKLILFTSGTTSTPKAIMLSEDNICSNVEAISAYLKLKRNDNILLVKDLSHSSSIIGELLVGLYNGCKVIFSEYLPMPMTILNMLSSYKISVFFAVPSLLKGIIEFPQLKKFDLSALRIINFYGSSMNSSDIDRLIKIFSGVNIIYSYGQTEASPRVTYIEKKDILKHPGSCGRPIEKVCVKILNIDDRECDAYEIGEIIVEGPNVMQGYYCNYEKTRQVIRQNRLYTGDYGYIDKEGFLYIVGRKDNMIINSGKNIYLEEVEGILLAYPGIMEVLVQPQFENSGTCELLAYIVVDERLEIDKLNLLSFCKDRLELYKIPRDVFVVKELKKTPSGKIIRKQEPIVVK